MAKNVVIDNYSQGKLYEYLKNKLGTGTKASFVSAYFTVTLTTIYETNLIKLMNYVFYLVNQHLLKKLQMTVTINQFQ